MNAIDRDLAALLGSRICHDLISPLGAIGNGVELLEMSGTPSPELALIAESVASASARIRFFRVAFGAAAPDQRLSRAEIADVVAAFAPGRRVAIDWQAEGDVPRDAGRLIFLLLLCMESALAWGGAVTVSRGAGGWAVAAAAERLRIDPTLWSVLTDPGPLPEVTPAEVHFPLAAAAAAAMGRPLSAEVTPASVSVTF
jgi:histidine phosphotransferase ChpT